MSKDDDIRKWNGEKEIDTFSDHIICPYCGNGLSGYDDLPELYESGDHELECNECGKTFVLNTMISYFYETRKTDSLNE